MQWSNPDDFLYEDESVRLTYAMHVGFLHDRVLEESDSIDSIDRTRS